jgi:hypothetical protein
MQKPKVFISHIKEEKVLAEAIKEKIQSDFLGMIDVFVSSDQVSISVGNKWLEEVDEALRNAQVELILCSQDSVGRPWINFEAGAGWIKGIPIVPICHTNMRLVDLPIPLNMLQGITASDTHGWEKVYRLLSNKLGSQIPNLEFSALIAKVTDFEHEYGLVREVKESVLSLIKLLPDLHQVFKPSPAHAMISGDVPDIQLDKMRAHLDILQNKGMLNYSVGGNKMVFGTAGSGGNLVELKIQIQPLYSTIATQVI